MWENTNGHTDRLHANIIGLKRIKENKGAYTTQIRQTGCTLSSDTIWTLQKTKKLYS